MIRTLKIQINCGETTCASVPGEFCKYSGALKYGTIPICMLFSDKNTAYTVLEHKDGWGTTLCKVHRY